MLVTGIESKHPGLFIPCGPKGSGVAVLRSLGMVVLVGLRNTMIRKISRKTTMLHLMAGHLCCQPQHGSPFFPWLSSHHGPPFSKSDSKNSKLPASVSLLGLEMRIIRCGTGENRLANRIKLNFSESLQCSEAWLLGFKENSTPCGSSLDLIT